MRPLNIARPFLPTAILTVVFISASFISNAEDRQNESSWKNNHRYEYHKDGKHRSHNHEKDARGKGHKNHYRDYHYDRDYKVYKNDRRDYYNHPRYGRVYHRFERKPYILKHSHGNYYYSGNRFYTYHDGIGYCVTEPPRNVYFRELPFQCKRVYANGCEYYRNGDLFFRLSARGYVIVPAPVEFNVSVRF